MSDYTPTWFEIRERLEHDTWLTADEADRWLAEHDAKVRAETLREAAQSVHAEARWQAEQKMRGAVQCSGAETAVDRLLVIEKLFHEQADHIEKEAGE